MEKLLLTPKEVTQYILKVGKDKTEKSLSQLLLQGIQAGVYIALGAIAYFKVVALTADPGLGQFLGAVVFPLGIIAVLAMGAELFTSDCMMTIGAYNKNYSFTKVFKTLLIVLFANLIGSIIIAFLSNTSGIYSVSMMDVVIHKSVHKVEMGISELIFSGILCNIIVCTGICMAYSAKDGISKIFFAWFSIAVFVLSGTEHVVANMYYLFTAYFGGGIITLPQIGYNLLFVAIGNFIGGGIIVIGINHLLYNLKKQ